MKTSSWKTEVINSLKILLRGESFILSSTRSFKNKTEMGQTDQLPGTDDMQWEYSTLAALIMWYIERSKRLNNQDKWTVDNLWGNLKEKRESNKILHNVKGVLLRAWRRVNKVHCFRFHSKGWHMWWNVFVVCIRVCVYNRGCWNKVSWVNSNGCRDTVHFWEVFLRHIHLLQRKKKKTPANYHSND